MKAYVLGLLAFGIANAQSSPSVVIWAAKSEGQDSPVGAVEIATVNVTDTEDQQPQSEELRRCSVDQLLPPGLGGDFQSGWTPLTEDKTRPSGYNCTCPVIKASYYCKNGRTDFPVWVPKAVANKECAPVSRHELAKDPFPPGASIMFYGNSHLRQVVEGIMCQHAERIARREAVLMPAEDGQIPTMTPLDVGRQCRGCMPGYKHLTSSGCLHGEERLLAMRCCDDQAVFEFDNNVTVHYWFAHDEGNKSVEHAFQEFGTSVSDYDVVVANSGNKPVTDTEHVIASAQLFHRVGVKFLWLTTYDGVGNVRDWELDDQEAFVAAKGNLVPVHDMMETMEDFTVGAALGSDDEHFCLPGPPDEVGLLVLRLIWALHQGAPEV